MNARPLFVVTLRPEPGVDSWRALRAVLRTALRRDRLRCVAITTVPGSDALPIEPALERDVADTPSHGLEYGE